MQQTCPVTSRATKVKSKVREQNVWKGVTKVGNQGDRGCGAESRRVKCAARRRGCNDKLPKLVRRSGQISVTPLDSCRYRGRVDYVM